MSYVVGALGADDQLETSSRSRGRTKPTHQLLFHYYFYFPSAHIRIMEEKKRATKSGNEAKKVPPDGGWGWMVVLGVSLVNLSTRPIEPSFGLLFGDVLADLSIATTGAGIIVSTYEAVINFSGLLVGPLIKSYSYRRVAIVGGVLSGLGLIATYPAASMTHILCTYSIINGLGIGFSSSATFVSLNHYFKKRRGQAVGITMAGTGLGLMLMPQAVRYLTEEYDFAGSILILGAFAWNACVGSSLLQPVKWHQRTPKPEEGPLIVPKPKGAFIPPHITISHTISERDEEAEDGKCAEDGKGNRTEVSPVAATTTKKSSNERLIGNQKKWSMIRQNSLLDAEGKSRSGIPQISNTKLNKSSTETKLDRYFSEVRQKNVNGRKYSEITYPNNRVPSVSSCGNIRKTSDSNLAFSRDSNQALAISVKRRKGSTISNWSNMDFHGSCLQIHAIKHEVKKEIAPTSIKPVGAKKATLWSRFSHFMDLDLLKDPIFLNIMFGLSIFYVAELNFKMVVPFFLADLGHSKSETAFCLSMMAASDIVARVVLPPICDRITKKISRRNMFMVATIFCALSRSGLAETGEWIRLETILIISGFFRGATLINFMLVISEYCDERMEKLPAAFGLHMVAKGLFIVAFGPLIGLIRDATGSYPICIHAQSCFIFLCSIAWCFEYCIIWARKPKS